MRVIIHFPTHQRVLLVPLTPTTLPLAPLGRAVARCEFVAHVGGLEGGEGVAVETLRPGVRFHHPRAGILKQNIILVLLLHEFFFTSNFEI